MRYQGIRLNKTRYSLPVLQPTGTASPFYVPPDEEIFSSKEQMNKTKKDLFYRQNKLKIWERDISKEGLSIKDLNRIGQGPASAAPSISLNYPLNLMKATKLSMENNIHRTQSIKTYLNRKKQILRYQIKINNKKEQISKLQDATRQHQKGLKNCQNYLQEDINNFNTYLNLNKMQVRKVIKDSQQKAKNKNDRIRILKQKLQIKTDLTGKINSKIQVLQNLIKYKRFLDDFHSSSKLRRHSKVKSSSNLLLHPTRYQKPFITQNQVQYLKTNFIITNELQKYLENNDQHQDLKFQTPSQLMTMFLNLQEANLSIITNLNSIEERMEIVKFNYTEKRQKMSAKKAGLVGDKIQLIKQLASVDKEIDRLKIISCKEYKEAQLGLETEIYQIYKQFQTKQIPLQLKALPLQILKDIQKKLQHLSKTLGDARQQKPQFIQALQKNCFLQKREKKKIKISQMDEYLMKIQKIEADKQKQSEEKRKRRKVMKKNVINREAKEEKHVDNQTDQEEMDARRYLF